MRDNLTATPPIETVPEPPPKKTAKGIVYTGMLSICSCGKGVFRRGQAYRLAEDGYMPPPDAPRMTLQQAAALVEEHSTHYTTFERDASGDLALDDDGLPCLLEASSSCFEIVNMEVD